MTSGQPDDNAIRAAIEVRYQLTTEEGPAGYPWMVYSRKLDSEFYQFKDGFGDTPLVATQDWCERNGVPWEIPQE